MFIVNKQLTIIITEVTNMNNAKSNAQNYSARGKFNYASAEGIEIYMPEKKSKPASKPVKKPVKK